EGAEPSHATHKVITLGATGLDFSMNDDTGGLATIVPGEDKVILYPKFGFDGLASDAIQAKVGKLPVGIVFKRFGKAGRFLVGCHTRPSLYVLDGATLALVKQIPLQLSNPASLTASENPSDPYVYFFGVDGEYGRAGRISLDTLTNEGTIELEGPAN